MQSKTIVQYYKLSQSTLTQTNFLFGYWKKNLQVTYFFFIVQPNVHWKWMEVNRGWVGWKYCWNGVASYSRTSIRSVRIIQFVAYSYTHTQTLYNLNSDFRFGRRTILITCLLIGGTMGLLKSFSPNYLMFFILQIFEGTLSTSPYIAVFVLGMEFVGRFIFSRQWPYSLSILL